ncbi:MAG: hypothetical protein QOK05_902 [Chloroflexota bacterium]|jgi:hypothetical protein|nr:hypothetical protein [Chloroflexota bacterium]
MDSQYPWVHAMQRARRLLWRLKIGVAATGTFALGLFVALAAGQSAAASAPSPSATPSAPATDVFGQSTQPGPDNQPNPVDPGLGQDPTQPAPFQPPRIVTAPS